MRVKGVATQGRQDSNQWVKRYTLSYSVDGIRYHYYKEGRKIKVWHHEISKSVAIVDVYVADPERTIPYDNLYLYTIGFNRCRLWGRV